jgi:hypothetical protein
MKSGVAAIGVLAVALVGCGSKQVTNGRLASDLSTMLSEKTSLVCWTKPGQLGQLSGMKYDRVCGLSLGRPSIYVRTGVSQKPGWCLVTPRLKKTPVCAF